MHTPQPTTSWLLALLLLLELHVSNHGVDGITTLTAMDNANFTLVFPLWLNPPQSLTAPERAASDSQITCFTLFSFIMVLVDSRAAGNGL